MDREIFRRCREGIEENSVEHAEAGAHCMVQAILLLAEIANEQCEEMKLTRLAVEEETHRYDGDKR